MSRCRIYSGRRAVPLSFQTSVRSAQTAGKGTDGGHYATAKRRRSNNDDNK